MVNISKLQFIINQIHNQKNDLYYNFSSHCGLSDSALRNLYAVNIFKQICKHNILYNVWIHSRQTENSSVSSFVKKGLLSLRSLPALAARKPFTWSQKIMPSAISISAFRMRQKKEFFLNYPMNYCGAWKAILTIKSKIENLESVGIMHE